MRAKAPVIEEVSEVALSGYDDGGGSCNGARGWLRAGGG